MLLGLPFMAELVSGSWVRLGRLDPAEAVGFAALVLVSATFWATLLSLAGRGGRHALGRLAVGAALGLALGVHWVMWNHYASLLSSGLLDQASRHGWDVGRTLLAGWWELLLWLVTPVLVSGLLAVLSSVPALLHQASRRLRYGLLAASLVLTPLAPLGSVASRPSDLAILDSLCSFFIQKATGRIKPALANPSLPWLPALKGNRYSLLLILTESVRHDAYCEDPAAPCSVTPLMNQVFPDRVPLGQMRAVSSWTIQSFAAITTGLNVLASRQELEHAPSIFDFARAAGRHTEMLGSQRLQYLFLRTAGIDRVITFENLGVSPNYEYADEDLTRVVDERLRSPREPYLVLMQLGDTHTPYTVDPQAAPFTPLARDFSWASTAKLHRQYLNAIYRQDRILGRLMQRLRAQGSLDRTVVLFTSDHGEAFREHSQLFHGGSLREEEVHVPAWVWIPEGLRKSLGTRYQTLLDRRHDFVTHLDLLPTMLDFMGVGDDPALVRYLRPLFGRSLLRPRADFAPVPLSNCSELMACAFKTYGVLGDGYQLEAREWDGYWNCWKIETQTLLSMSSRPCQKLLLDARILHPRLPNGRGY
jgi:hypothetical protein